MPILYNLRTHPSGFMMAKFDDDLNLAAAYLLKPIPMGYYACECPASTRPNCKHRRMVGIFVAAKAVDTDRFYCYETQMWHRPIPTAGEGEATAERAAELTNAGEGPEPSLLAATLIPSPSASRQSEPAPPSSPSPKLRRLLASRHGQEEGP